jgi:DNA polymerase IV
VRDALQLSCSVGIAPNKFLAKLASEAAKPKASPEGVDPGAGVVEVEPGGELAFLHPLPVQALWGVGPSTLDRLRRLGVVTVADLAELPLGTLVTALGKASGTHLHALAHAIDDRPVVADRGLKSVGHEETFGRDKYERSDLEIELVRLADAVAARLRANDLAGRTVTLKVRFGDFRTITRSSTLGEPLDTAPAIAAAARALLDAIDPSTGVRLLGVSVSSLRQAPGRQLTLESTEGWDRASRAIDEIRDRFGDRSIGPAVLVRDGEIHTVGKGSPKWGPDDREGP